MLKLRGLNFQLDMTNANLREMLRREQERCRELEGELRSSSRGGNMSTERVEVRSSLMSCRRRVGARTATTTSSEKYRRTGQACSFARTRGLLAAARGVHLCCSTIISADGQRSPSTAPLGCRGPALRLDQRHAHPSRWRRRSAARRAASRHCPVSSQHPRNAARSLIHQ